MKIRIKAYNGELPSYLTVGKVYEVVLFSIHGDPKFITDDNFFLTVDMDDSSALNGGSWEVVSE